MAENGIVHGSCGIGGIESRAVGPEIGKWLVVGDAETRANGGGAMAEGIPRDSDARCEVMLVGGPELFDAADGRRGHRGGQAVSLAQNNIVLQAVDFAGRAENAVAQA